jgi:hypothetical protein
VPAVQLPLQLAQALAERLEVNVACVCV